MTKEQMIERLEEIVEALKDENTEVDTDALEEEARGLRIEIEKLNKIENRKAIAEQINNGVIEARKVLDEETRKVDADDIKRKAVALKEQRSITVSSGTLLTPKHQSKEINDNFNEVSSLIDEVNIDVLDGGESFQEPYVKSYGEGGETDEAGNYVDAEPEFGYADITKVKITAYAEISEEAEKLPAQDYVAKVEQNMKIALKKKMVEHVLNGNGSKAFTGIFKNNKEITGDTDVNVSTIDNNTLDEIIFSYGGAEDVENDAVLILSKEDLKAFSKVRSDDGKKFYDIDVKNETIDKIPYIISSKCHPVSNKKDAAGSYDCMAYGSLKNYKVTLFSDMDIQKSTDFKFKQGITCYKASVQAGGNVVRKDGFVRVKKVVA